MLSLNNAIQLIRQGQKEEARQILEPLLKGEPGNIQAWFWYVETFPTTEKRIQTLEVCLKLNPGNPTGNTSFAGIADIPKSTGCADIIHPACCSTVHSADITNSNCAGSVHSASCSTVQFTDTYIKNSTTIANLFGLV